MIDVRPLPIVSGPPDKLTLDTAITSDSIAWGCLGSQSVRIDLLAETWPSGAIATLEVGNTLEQFSAHPSGAITYNSVGMKSPVSVAGMAFVRLRITSTGTGTIRPIVHGYSEN